MEKNELKALETALGEMTNAIQVGTGKIAGALNDLQVVLNDVRKAIERGAKKTK